jgi:hypothetical protein
VPPAGDDTSSSSSDEGDAAVRTNRAKTAGNAPSQSSKKSGQQQQQRRRRRRRRRRGSARNSNDGGGGGGTPQQRAHTAGEIHAARTAAGLAVPDTPTRPDLVETLSAIDMLQVARDQLRTAQSIRETEDADIDPAKLLDIAEPSSPGRATARSVNLSHATDVQRVTDLRGDAFRRKVLDESMGTWHHINYQLSAREEGVRRGVMAGETGRSAPSATQLPELFVPGGQRLAAVSIFFFFFFHF